MSHTAVMVAEAMQGLVTDAHGIYLDATFGVGGHSAALLEMLDDDGRLIGMDRDQQAIQGGTLRFAEEPRLQLIQSPFSQMGQHLHSGTVTGILMDLGISSVQLDDEERGFSFHAEQSLDMRMDRQQGETGAELLSRLPADELAQMFADYGAERYARPIAEEVVRVRELMGGEMTAAGLSALICRTKPARDGRRHPATRVFQALRIGVNDEMGELRSGLQAAEQLLQEGGRLVVISFHSLEDQAVAGFIASADSLQSLGRMRKPTKAEKRANPRSRSAMLRTMQKVLH